MYNKTIKDHSIDALIGYTAQNIRGKVQICQEQIFQMMISLGLMPQLLKWN